MMKYFFAALLLATSSMSHALVEAERMRFSGVITAVNEKYAEVKTSRATLIVPKAMIAKEQFKTNNVVDIEIASTDMNQIKLKK